MGRLEDLWGSRGIYGVVWRIYGAVGGSTGWFGESMGWLEDLWGGWRIYGVVGGSMGQLEHLRDSLHLWGSRGIYGAVGGSMGQLEDLQASLHLWGSRGIYGAVGGSMGRLGGGGRSTGRTRLNMDNKHPQHNRIVWGEPNLPGVPAPVLGPFHPLPAQFHLGFGSISPSFGSLSLLVPSLPFLSQFCPFFHSNFTPFGVRSGRFCLLFGSVPPPFWVNFPQFWVTFTFGAVPPIFVSILPIFSFQFHSLWGQVGSILPPFWVSSTSFLGQFHLLFGSISPSFGSLSHFWCRPFHFCLNFAQFFHSNFTPFGVRSGRFCLLFGSVPPPFWVNFPQFWVTFTLLVPSLPFLSQFCLFFIPISLPLGSGRVDFASFLGQFHLLFGSISPNFGSLSHFWCRPSHFCLNFAHFFIPISLPLGSGRVDFASFLGQFHLLFGSISPRFGSLSLLVPSLPFLSQFCPFFHSNFTPFGVRSGRFCLLFGSVPPPFWVSSTSFLGQFPPGLGHFHTFGAVPPIFVSILPIFSFQFHSLWGQVGSILPPFWVSSTSFLGQFPPVLGHFHFWCRPSHFCLNFAQFFHSNFTPFGVRSGRFCLLFGSVPPPFWVNFPQFWVTFTLLVPSLPFLSQFCPFFHSNFTPFGVRSGRFCLLFGIHPLLPQFPHTRFLHRFHPISTISTPFLRSISPNFFKSPPNLGGGGGQSHGTPLPPGHPPNLSPPPNLQKNPNTSVVRSIRGIIMGTLGPHTSPWGLATMHPWVLLALLCGCPPPSAPDWMRHRRRFFRDAGGSFGHSVAQVNGGILVGAPLEPEGAGGTGRVYRCQFGTGRCQVVPIAANGSQILACGPTARRACGVNVELRGLCFLLSAGNTPTAPLPDCPVKASDIVFLMDGSGSVSTSDFERMKTFIIQVMKRFQSTDTRFALMQFSSKINIHFDFATFARLSPAEWEKKVGLIAQQRGLTFTASAIQTVVRELFNLRKGARAGAHRILIVVTDGQKFGDTLDYRQVIGEAEGAGIIRYAIGVGSAFVDADAVEELRTIASKPSEDHVFQVNNFDALQGIQNQLQDKIFAIEGTQSADSSSFQLEMAQEGFSALLTPEGPVLGAVGAYDWSGGVFVYGRSGETTFVNVSRAAGDMNDAYLGYAAESLSLGGRRALALGAPRYRHVGRLLLFHLRGPRAAWELLADATGPQVGSYFGASLCALDPDGDGSAEVVLVGAPMFYGAGGGGRVAVCTLRPKGGRLQCQQMLQGQPGHPLGRFGASLARLGDVDGDRWPDVAVGAPLEDEERGAVYVFRGKQGGVASQYSQRISGAGFSSRPRYFGQAISGGQDLTGDRLPDVAVGAQGQVLLLRSQPLLRIRVTVTFEPQEIPAAAFDCQEEEVLKGEVAKARICFLGTKKTPDNFGSQLSTTLRYQAALDPSRAMVRAVFTGGGAVRNGTLQLGVGQKCETFGVAFTGCPQDTLTPLVLRLTYDATGDPIGVAGGLRPALSEDSVMVAVGTLPFEKDCGADNVCVDDLRISFDFSGLETVVVGVTDVVDVTVTLRNRGEDSYGTTVQLHHAAALSYRKA
ncbi:integrin alpha-X, partial [Accipiter gentilis]|uniref:integrin alpha-X n=1 Tax=Astur gentilis TaxID=8957 RepID=UPI002110477E